MLNAEIGFSFSLIFSIIENSPLINQYNPHRFKQKKCLISVENSTLEVIKAYIDHRVTRVGKVGSFEVGIAEQRPLEITPAKIGFDKTSVAKIDLFGSALSHHQSLYIQTEKVAVIEEAFTKTDRISVQQTLPIRHRPVDPDHLARDKFDIAHFAIGQFHQTQIAVFKTAFGKFAGGEKGLAEITRDEGAVIEFSFGDLFAVQIDSLEFFGEYVHRVGDTILIDQWLYLFSI